MEIEGLPASQLRADKCRAAQLKWRGKPPGIPPEMAVEFMARLKAGSTVRKLTGGGTLGPAIVSLDRFKKHCELHPVWGAEAWRISKANTANGKGTALRLTTHCRAGLHLMTESNIYIDGSHGRRRCLACRNIARANPPLIDPIILAKIKQAFEAGGSIAQICIGRPIGGGAINKRTTLTNTQKFYHQRRVDPEFDRFVLSHIADSCSVGQQVRWRRIKTRIRTDAARNEANDYHAIRAMIPTHFPDRDDIVSRIFEDLFSGAIRRDDVRSRIKDYISEHNRMFPTKFAKFGDARLVSLDEVLFEDGSTTRGDTVSRGLWD